MPPPKDETEEQKAIRLAKAKKQAAKSREEKMVEKYKDKVLEKEKKKQVKDESESEDEDEETPKKPLKPVKPIKEEVTEEVKEEEEKPKPKPKPKTKAKAKVIIEQSSDDEDTFEASKDVIFVKRVRAKKVEQQHAPQSDYRSASAPMPPSVATNPVTRQEQPLPQRFQQQQQQQQAPPPKPQISQEKRLEMERYLNMTRGNFLPMSRPR
jgi:hypothetical protein